MKYDIIIIGGGAAGLIASIASKDFGSNVAIVEAKDRVGKKILTTGNGRCNVSNTSIDSHINTIPLETQNTGSTLDNFPFHGENVHFSVPALRDFNVADTINFFDTIGIPLTELDEGKLFPMSLQASSVLDIFRLSITEREIPVFTDHKVSTIKPSHHGFSIVCRHLENEVILSANKIIFCTGGKSAPNTGSDGSGYAILKNLGHSVIQPVPALVQLKLDYNHLKALSGIKFQGRAEIFVDGTSSRKECGEILFTDYGISGPPILQLSRIASYNLHKKSDVTLKVDFFPDYELEQLKDFLETHWAIFSHRSVHDSFIGILNKKIIPIILKEASINDIQKPCWELDWKEKRALYSLLKSWLFKVTDTNSFVNAQVTAGGINTDEINPVTLESKLIPNLYIAGEVLDVDGDCGGYNLQWAWSSGYTAAKSACTKNL